MSENMVNTALRRQGHDKDAATAHRLRATARTLMAEQLNINPTTAFLPLELAGRPRGASVRRSAFPHGLDPGLTSAVTSGRKKDCGAEVWCRAGRRDPGPRSRRQQHAFRHGNPCATDTAFGAAYHLQRPDGNRRCKAVLQAGAHWRSLYSSTGCSCLRASSPVGRPGGTGRRRAACPSCTASAAWPMRWTTAAPASASARRHRSRCRRQWCARCTPVARCSDRGRCCLPRRNAKPRGAPPEQVHLADHGDATAARASDLWVCAERLIGGSACARSPRLRACKREGVCAGRVQDTARNDENTLIQPERRARGAANPHGRVVRARSPQCQRNLDEQPGPRR